MKSGVKKLIAEAMLIMLGFCLGVIAMVILMLLIIGGMLANMLPFLERLWVRKYRKQQRKP